MRSLPAAIFERLSAAAPVKALIGDRLFPNHLAPGVTYPAACFQIISDVSVGSLLGYTSGLRTARVQVDAYSRVFSEADAVALAVADCLKSVVEPGFKSRYMDRRDTWEREGDGSDGAHRAMVQFAVAIEEDA